jgi:hypothetical protein
MNQKVIIVTLAAMAIAVAGPLGLSHLRSANNSELEVQQAFNQWKLENKRLYGTTEEHNVRYDIFKSNYMRIKSYNAKNTGATLKINETADLTMEEFAKEYGLESYTAEDGVKEAKQLNQQPAPKTFNIDWAKRGKSNPSNSNGDCHGAGNLISAVAAYESIRAIKWGVPVVKSSAQLVLDCMKNTKGCQGDTCASYLSYLYNYGTNDLSSYPWVNKLQQCNTSVKPTASLADYIKSTQTADSTYINAAIRAPFLIWFSVSFEARFYENGVYEPSTGECHNSSNAGVYVVVDGFSIDKSYNGHYKLKFPWGTSFGESGYMKFVKKSGDNYYTKDRCGIYNTMYTLTA